MEKPFIIKFIEEVLNMVHDVGEAVSRVPYKGYRYSSFGSNHRNNQRSYAGFKNLERRNIIRRSGDDRFVFTNQGRQWLRKSANRYFKNKYRIWDHKWRVVIFDIPTELHRERNKLRFRLKSLGFIMLQKSVFVIPYACEEELGDICGKLKIADYVDIITAESIGFRTEELLKIFHLK